MYTCYWTLAEVLKCVRYLSYNCLFPITHCWIIIVVDNSHDSPSISHKNPSHVMLVTVLMNRVQNRVQSMPKTVDWLLRSVWFEIDFIWIILQSLGYFSPLLGIKRGSTIYGQMKHQTLLCKYHKGNCGLIFVFLLLGCVCLGMEYEHFVLLLSLLFCYVCSAHFTMW